MFEVGPDHEIEIETRFKSALEQRDKKDLVTEVASLMGIPTCCPGLPSHPGIRSLGRAAELPRYT